MKPTSQTEWLFKTIARVDSYVISTNPKTSILIAFNTFAITASVSGWSAVANLFENHVVLHKVAGVFSYIAIAGAFASLYFSLRAVAPYLKSPKVPNGYHSKLFFEHIKEYPTEEAYYQDVSTLDEAGMAKELAYQIHAVSRGASKKFADLTVAMRFVLFVVIPSFLMVFGLKLVASILDVFNK